MNLDNNRKRWLSGAKGTALLLCVFLFSFVFGSAAFARELGERENFFVDEGYDYYSRSSVDAFRAYESENAVFYIEERYYDSLSNVQKISVKNQVRLIGDEFDETIYPTTRKIFGEEWNPGIDGSEKIVVLFNRLQYGIGGYYYPYDEYPKDSLDDGISNESEIIYLNPDFLKSGKVEGFLAHELQHMIYWNEKTRSDGLVDELWMNEGRSELASALVEDALGKSFGSQNLSVRMEDFLKNYEDSVMDWSESDNNYATVNIFMEYLKDHFGTGIFKRLNDTRKTGGENLDHVLRTDEGISLEAMFTNWTLANYINDVNYDIRYGYENEHLKEGFRVEPTLINDENNEDKEEYTGKIKNWSGEYYEIDLTGRRGENLFLKLGFDGGDDGQFALPYVINYSDGSMETGSIDLNDKQKGGKNLIFAKGVADSVVLILSGQKLEPVGEDKQVDTFTFALDVEFASAEEIMRPDGTLLRLENDGKVFVVEGGKKRWITDVATFLSRGYDWKDVVEVEAGEMSLYPEGELLKAEVALMPDGTLVRGDGDKVYVIDGGKRRHIVDAETFNACGYDWSKITRVSERDLAMYAVGEDKSKIAFADGALIKGSGPRIYMIENGKKRWVTSPEAFVKNRFNWSSVVKTSEAVVSSYQDGRNIQ